MLGLILAFIAGAAVWVWRIRTATEAGKMVVDTVQDAGAAVRRYRFRRKTGGSPVDGIEDPRLAAAGIMAILAKMDGDYTRDQISGITAECMSTFSCTQKEAEELTAFGRWLASEVSIPQNALGKLADFLKTRLTPHEADQMLGMAERVAALESGGLSDAQVQALDMLRMRLEA